MKSPALAVVIAAGVARLAIAAFAPLFPDETYYWDWSRHLATGYFDHPPLVAWLIRLGTLVFGFTPLGVRFGAVLAGTLGSVIIAMTARRLAGDRAALLAAVVFAVMPLSAAGLVLATPDAALMAAAAAVVYLVLRAVEQPAGTRSSLLWWCAAGAAQGVAFWAKYTAILVPVALLLSLIVFAELRSRLREPGPYVATLIASLVFSPVLLWNSRHGWVSFGFQLQHGLVGSGGSVLRREGELIGGQLGVASPILFVMMLVAVVAALRGAMAGAATRMQAMITVFVLGFFAYSATQRRVEANWPALAYVAATPLLALFPRSPRWDRWLNGGIAVAVAITLITYVNTFAPILPVPAPRDPAARASGWDDLASVVGRVRDSIAVSRLTGHESRPFIAANRYQEASELAFHLPDHPQTLAFNVDGRPNQYDLWPRFADRALPGDGLILVVDDMVEMHPAAALLVPHFASVTRGAPVSLTRRGNVVKNLRLWVLSGWRGTWPAAPIRSAP